MKPCKTCKHFSRQPIMGSKELYQVCGYEAFTEELRKDDAGMSICTDDPYTTVWIEVGPEFGCVKHEEQDGGPR